MRRSVLGALFACAGVLASGPAHAESNATPLVLDANARHYDLTRHVEYLADPDASLSFDDVRADDHDLAWFQSSRTNPNFGFTDAAYWLRLEVHNPTDAPLGVIVAFQYPLLDEVDLFVVDGDEVRTLNIGDQKPFSSREIPYTELSTVLDTDPGQTHWLYARVATASSMQIGLIASSVPGFVERTTRTQLFHGIYYGIMLVMALYNLFLYLAVRSRAYLIYVVFVVVFTGTQLALDGVATRYLFPEWPSLANMFTPLVVGVAQIPPVLFAQSFLDTRQLTPRLHRVLNGYMVFISIGIPLSLFAPYSVSIRFVALGAVLTSLVCLVTGLVALRIGYRPARFFVLAWSALIVGTVLYVLMTVGVLPANELTTNIQRVGSAIEVSLLSFALGDRIKIIEREREAARARALALDHDLLLTGAVQQLFLPKRDRFSAAGVDLVGFYRPADRSGGDWWWYEDAEDGGLRVLVGDIAGHGVAAAMLTGAVAASYQNIAKAQADRPLPDNLREVAASFRHISEGAHNMSLVAFEIDARRRMLKVWSAGAPPVLVLRDDGSVVPLLSTGTLMGDDEVELGESSLELRPGDRIFAFSDGLPEMLRPNGRQVGYAGISRILRQTHEDDAARAKERIETRLDDLRGSEPQRDDFCFVIVDIDPAGTR